MKQAAERGRVLLSGHNHAISQSPLVSTDDVKIMLEDMKSKYGVATTNGNGIGIIRNDKLNRTKEEIDKIEKALNKYDTNMRRDFDKVKPDDLTKREDKLFNQLQNKVITKEEYKSLSNEAYKEYFAKFKFENTDKYAKQLDEILRDNNMRFQII